MVKLNSCMWKTKSWLTSITFVQKQFQTYLYKTWYTSNLSMWRTILREICGHSKKEGIHNQANYISSLMKKKIQDREDIWFNMANSDLFCHFLKNVKGFQFWGRILSVQHLLLSQHIPNTLNLLTTIDIYPKQNTDVLHGPETVAELGLRKESISHHSTCSAPEQKTQIY